MLEKLVLARVFMYSERCRHSAHTLLQSPAVPSFSSFPKSSGLLLLATLGCGACGGAAPLNAAHALRAQASESPSLTAEPVAASAAAATPYAPRRIAASKYLWQRPLGIVCAPKEPALLHFSGSSAEFPLLPEDAPGAAREPAVTVVPPPDGDTRSPDAIVSSLRPRLRTCFAQMQERRGSAQGTARFALELACNGVVNSISAETQSLDEQAVVCLFGLVGPSVFPPPPGGHGTLQMPVVFRNSEH